MRKSRRARLQVLPDLGEGPEARASRFSVLRSGHGRRLPVSQTNLHKSDEGWRRFRERTQSGAFARRARMDHRVQSALPTADVEIPKFEGDDGQRRKRRKRRRVVAPNGRTF